MRERLNSHPINTHEIARAFLSSEVTIAQRIDEVDDLQLLGLIFTSCHPVLSTDARAALTLRVIGGLTEMEAMKAMGKFNEELVNAGIMLAGGGDGLKPSSHGKRIAFDGPGRTVIDGPFAETRELVAGFWLWEVKDMDEAVAWVKRCPNPMPGPSEIEIRPLYEMASARYR